MLLRLDGRIEWTDLLMRMEYPGYTEKDEQKVRNRLQQRMARFRERFVMVSWRDTAGDNNAIRDRVLDKLTPAQLAARGGLGTTRGSTPGSRDSQGRVVPVPGRRPPKTANTRKTAIHSLASSRALPNRRRNVDTNPTMGGAQQPYTSTLQEPHQLLSDEEDWGYQDFGRDVGDDDNDEQGDGEGGEYYDEDGSDLNEEADADMVSTEESPRMKSLTPEECCELERYLKENRIRTQMCLEGVISVDELMLDMQNNEEELKQGLKRTRGETSDDDEVEELQSRRAKRTKREESATGSSSAPLSELQEPTFNSFNISKPRPWGEYRRQGALAKTYGRPTTRPVGSAVQRLHNDGLRRPHPKATVGQKDIHDSLHYHQPYPIMDREWTVFHSHIDPQPTPYLPQQPGVEEGLYTNIGQRQGQLTPYESRQDDTMESRNSDTNGGERRPRPSPRHQRQPDGPPDSDKPSDSGSSSDLVESTRLDDEHTAPYRARQQPAARAIQDDPFFPDELFNGMLNGQPDNNHVGSIYTWSQQQEIDEYYYRLMAPRPRPEAQTNARQGPMPPPPRPRMEEGGGVPQQHIPRNVPVAHAQSGNAPPVAQVTQDASDPTSDTTTLWDPEWWAFVNDHDAEHLLRAHYQDDNTPGSPRGTPQR